MIRTYKVMLSYEVSFEDSEGCVGEIKKAEEMRKALEIVESLSYKELGEGVEIEGVKRI